MHLELEILTLKLLSTQKVVTFMSLMSLLAMTDEMYNGLDEERKKMRLASVAEVARVILGDYFKNGKQAGL